MTAEASNASRIWSALRPMLPPTPWRPAINWRRREHVVPADDLGLRGYLERILGWRRPDAVEAALRSIHLGAARRAAVVLRGEGDLVPAAAALHRHVLGADAPFIVSDPRRGNTTASVRSPANLMDCFAAFEAARGGTLCVRARRPPPDFPQVVAALRDPSAYVQLIVCCRAGDDGDPLLAVPGPLDVPPLRERAGELAEIIDEYARDAAAALNAGPPLGGADRAWILEHAASSLDEIDKAAMRLTALRASRSLSAAAARLGMAPVSLSRWIGRRKLPDALAHDLGAPRPPT